MMNKFVFWILFLLFPQLVFAVPAIQHWTMGNGTKVYFTQANEIPIVDVRVVFDAGAARDGDQAGVAALTNSLLTEGAGKLSADMIAERLDNVGAQMGSGSLRDMAWLSLRSLSEEEVLRETIDLMSLVLSRPTFPKRSLERQRKSMLVSIRASKQSPSSLAEEAFMKAVYGAHPYASPPGGTEKSINSLTPEDVQQYYEKYYVTNNAIIVIVGDLSRLKAEALAETLTAGMGAGNKAPELPEVKAVESQMVRVDFPSTQTHVWVGQPGMKRTDKDYYSLYVGNHALGGSGLVSILSDEVREKRGFAYSVYSYFSPMRELGPFQMALQTKNEHALEAFNVLTETTKRYIDDGITSKQLAASKQNITGGFALRLDSNKKIAENLAMIGFYGLPLDYLNNFNTRIENVTVESVNEAFKRRVKPESMITVIVGPETPSLAENHVNKE